MKNVCAKVVGNPFIKMAVLIVNFLLLEGRLRVPSIEKCSESPLP